ncbi:MAG TPA: serine hydrolase domain-containing protein [Chitinophagaceae bacterium]|nr:serine hydrolase domain-containing protein [Chitinophagaceae bacterium]
MRKIIVTQVLIFISAFVFGQTIVRLDNSRIVAHDLDTKINYLMKEASVSGIAISIFNEGKPIYHKAFGYKNVETKIPLQTSTNFYGASFSKAVFAVLVMKLVEEKIISLDKPLQEYLPKPVYEYGKGASWNQDYTSLKEDELYKKITARHCLSHSSGFSNWRWDEPDQKLRVHFEPGSQYSYSGEGLCYLQFVIENLTAKTLNGLMQEKLFGPLGIKRSSYTWQPAFEANYCLGHDKTGKPYPKDKDNAPRAASTLETTPDDYSLFTAAVLQKKILKPATYDTLFKQQLRLRSKFQMGPEAWKDSTSENDNILLGYALGWGRLQTPVGFGVFKEGHGDGFQHYTILFPEQKSGIVIFTNSDNGESIFKELLEFAIGDIFTPWKWQRYIPYNQKNVQ